MTVLQDLIKNQQVR